MFKGNFSISVNKNESVSQLRRIFLYMTVRISKFIFDIQVFVYEFQILQSESDRVVSVQF